MERLDFDDRSQRTSNAQTQYLVDPAKLCEKSTYYYITKYLSKPNHCIEHDDRDLKNS